MSRNAIFLSVTGMTLALLTVSGCQNGDTVSFARDVKPTLDEHCLECHQQGGAGHTASGLDLSSYEGLMAGTRGGPMVIPGDSLGSNLIVLMEGRADPSIAMPHGYRKKVRQAQIETIKAWIDQGAKAN